MREQTNARKLLNVQEAADYLGLATGTVYHMISEGRLPVIRLSKRCVRFRLEDIEAWLDKRAAPSHLPVASKLRHSRPVN